MQKIAQTLILCLCFVIVVSLPLHLAPYGPRFGDTIFNQPYDRSETIDLAVPFFVGTNSYTVAYVSIKK